MPEYTALAKIPYPLWPEADEVPVDLKQAFEVIDPLLVLRATDEADRDARYSDVPAGTIVSGTEQDAIWRKKAGGGWSTIWYDTGWKRITNFLNGWTAGAQVSYRVKTDICYWRGAFRPPDQEHQVVQTWQPILNVPAEAQPTTALRFAVSSDTSITQLSMRFDPGTGQLFGWLYSKGGGWMNPPDAYPTD